MIDSIYVKSIYELWFKINKDLKNNFYKGIEFTK